VPVQPIDQGNMKTRILLNWTCFTSPCGALRRSQELHRRLQNNQDLTALITGAFPAQYRTCLEGMRFIGISKDRGPVFKWREVFGIPYRHYFSGSNFDIWAEEVPPAPNTKGLKLVLTVHDLRYASGLRFASVHRYINLAMRLRSSISRASAIIAVSRTTAAEITCRFGIPESDVHVIPNGIDPNISARPALRDRLFQEPYILAVGHLEKRKNYEMLISAFSIVARQWGGILVLAGKDSGMGSKLKAKALEEGIPHRIRFTGSVPDEVLWTLLRDCEILACPSLYEGFGMTLLEGMAMNVPVVASNIPAHFEVASDGACLVDTGIDMTEPFAASLLSVIDDTGLRSSLVESGRERVGMFSWDDSAKKLAKLYTTLAEWDT